MLEISKDRRISTSESLIAQKHEADSFNIIPFVLSILGGGLAFTCSPLLSPLVAGTIYVAANQFKVAKKIPSSEEFKKFEVIDQSIFKTTKDKEDYLRFLKSEASFAVKLFGWHKNNVEISKEEAKKQWRMLDLCFHPDKNGEEKELCTSIFVLIQENYALFIGKPKDQVLLDYPYSPKFLKFLKEEDWAAAKHTLNAHPQFIPLFALKEGDFQVAIEACNELFADFIPVLSRCQNSLLKSDLQELLRSLLEVEQLSSLFEKRLGIDFMPSDIVSYTLYLAIARCYQNSGSFVNYEIFLRLAIRNCHAPQKTCLIEELKVHIKPNCTFDKQERIDKEIDDICKEIKTEICSLGEDLNALLDNFIEAKNWVLLEKFLTAIENKEYSRFSFLPEILKNTLDSKFTPEMGHLRSFKLLKGINCLLKKDWVGAVFHFEQEKHFLLHALCRMELKNYRGALSSLSKLPESDLFIKQCAFEAMNLHDCDHLQVEFNKRLREIDDFQMRILENTNLGQGNPHEC